MRCFTAWFFFFFHVVNTTRLPPMPDDFTFPCRLPPFPYSNQDWPSRFIELICYDFLLLSICMFFVHFCVLPYVLAGFQHMQSSQLPSVSFLCFVFFRDCFVKEGKQEQEKLKSWKKEKKEKKTQKKGQVLVMSFRAWWFLLIRRYTNFTQTHTLILYFICSSLFVPNES